MFWPTGFPWLPAITRAPRAERDNLIRIRAVENRHIDLYPDGERLEVREILERKGLSGQVLEDATSEICSNRENWIALMLEGEYGLSAADPEPLRAATATFLAFLVAGMIPLLPFLIGIGEAFTVSVIMTMVVFFMIGAVKSRWALSRWWWSGMETLAIGGGAAAIAFAVGRMFAI